MQELYNISFDYKPTEFFSKTMSALVFLDELGINTSIEQGLPLMWSLCENLLSLKRVGTVIATHNLFLN
jgi:DNA mismatch repair ATPase MutS